MFLLFKKLIAIVSHLSYIYRSYASYVISELGSWDHYCVTTSWSRSVPTILWYDILHTKQELVSLTSPQHPWPRAHIFIWHSFWAFSLSLSHVIGVELTATPLHVWAVLYSAIYIRSCSILFLMPVCTICQRLVTIVVTPKIDCTTACAKVILSGQLKIRGRWLFSHRWSLRNLSHGVIESCMS